MTRTGHPFRRWVASVSATTPSHNRFGLLRHVAAARHLHFRVMAHQNYIKPAMIGPAASTTIADRIYQCNAASGGGASEKAGR
jgi:hypothetical protein